MSDELEVQKDQGLAPREGASGRPVAPSDSLASRAPKPELLLSQYENYLQDLSNVGARQAQTNAWNVTILSGLAAFVVYDLPTGAPDPLHSLAIAGAALTGVGLARIWVLRAKSYQLLYNAKFKVLREMEDAGLPFKCFGREIEKLDVERPRFTNLEQWVGRLLTVPFAVVLILSLWQVLSVWFVD